MKLPNLLMLIKQKTVSLPRNLARVTFGKLLIVLSAKVNLLYFLCLMALRCFLLHLRKQNCLLETFPRSNLDDSDITLPAFPLKLHNIAVTPMLVEKVITNLDFSKASRPVCIPVVALRRCGPEPLYLLAELSNMCLKESFSPCCWEFSTVFSVFKNVGGVVLG